MLWLSSIAIAQNPNSNPNAQAPWKLNGSQVDTTQFVGTTNNVDLVFKRNNVEGFRLLEDTSTRFMGNVFLDKFKEPPVNSGPPKEVFLKVDNQGKIISTDKSGLLSAIYDEQFPCLLLPNNQLPAPIWSAKPGVLYTGVGCPASVGIGTDNPVAALDVRGAGYFQGLGINTVPSNQYQLHINSSVGTTAGIYLNTNHPQGWPNVKYGFQNVVNNSNTIAYSVTDQTTNQDVFVVMGDGSVGVGTDNLNFSKLNVLAQNETGLTVTTNHTGDYGYGIRSMVAKNKTKAFAVYNAETQEESFVVLGNGNVGIGTTAVNGAKLSVEGIIRARRVLVNATPWADYVFEPTYQLMTINQLEEYITTNKHLPNIPTAKVVEKEGADLGEINRLLVEKVEELTLYIIELNKRMEQLEADNTLLKNKMDFK